MKVIGEGLNQEIQYTTEEVEALKKQREAEKIKFEFPKRVIERYTNAEHEWSSMLSFINEHSKDCDERHMPPPAYLIKRYSLSHEWKSVGLAWFLLDEYFKGNVVIKKGE